MAAFGDVFLRMPPGRTLQVLVAPRRRIFQPVRSWALNNGRKPGSSVSAADTIKPDAARSATAPVR